MMTTEISTAREQQLFNGKNFHVVIYNKTESVSRLHQHDYYEFTVVLTGRYYQEINGKQGAAGARGFRPLSRWARTTRAFTSSGRRASLTSASADASLRTHYLPLLPFGLVASQVYAVQSAFLGYVESVIASLNFRETEFDEIYRAGLLLCH